MQDFNKDIHSLIRSILEGNFTPEEFTVFQDWYERSEKNRVLFEKRRDEQWANRRVEVSDREVERSLIRLKRNAVERRKIGTYKSFGRIAAMLCLFLTASVIVYSIRQRRIAEVEPTAVIVAYEEDHYPENYGVELTVEGESPVDIVQIAPEQLDLREKIEELVGSAEASVSEVREQLPPVRNYTLKTRRNNRYRAVLPDGTRVWMNSGSQVVFPSVFPDDERVVSMRGECYFEVAPDASRPFKVKVDDVEITALGTAFNINAYLDILPTVAMSLSEGRVRFTADNHRLEATAGTRIEFDAENRTVARGAVNTDLYTGWMQGRYRFENCPFNQVLKYLEIWFDITIINSVTAAQELLLSGEFKQGDPLSAIASLCVNISAAYRYDQEAGIFYIESYVY